MPLSPSMVVISLPSCMTARARQELISHSVNQHRASAALAVVTSFFCARKIEPLTKYIQEDAPGRNLEVSINAVDFEAHRNFLRKGRRWIWYCSRFWAGDVSAHVHQIVAKSRNPENGTYYPFTITGPSAAQLIRMATPQRRSVMLRRLVTGF